MYKYKCKLYTNVLLSMSFVILRIKFPAFLGTDPVIIRFPSYAMYKLTIRYGFLHTLHLGPQNMDPVQTDISICFSQNKDLSTVCNISLFNPLCAKSFRHNINIYLHFMSLLHIDMTLVLKIIPQARPGPT